MRTDHEYPRLTREGGQFRSRISRILLRAGVVVLGTLILIGALAVSIALFAVALVISLVIGGYLWWRTRDLRREIRSALRGGNIIEGEVVRDSKPGSTSVPPSHARPTESHRTGGETSGWK